LCTLFKTLKPFVVQNRLYIQVISSEDIGLYGGLCALATLSRSELKTKVIDNPQFRSYLDMCPLMRDVILDFYLSNYDKCIKGLSKLRVWFFFRFLEISTLFLIPNGTVLKNIFYPTQMWLYLANPKPKKFYFQFEFFSPQKTEEFWNTKFLAQPKPNFVKK